MTNQMPKPDYMMRDGISQAERINAALDPGYVSIDESSTADLLLFAKKFAGKLKFFDEKNQLGDRHSWSGFFEPVPDLEAAADFINNPGKYNSKDYAGLLRPHFVLFLTFLKLLGHARRQMNGLTRRHLDYYYQTVLNLKKKMAVPDRVNVLITPGKNITQFKLPAGTSLDAGPDSRRQPRVYRTDRDVIVSQAGVEQLRSMYLHRKTTGFREAYEQHEGPVDEKYTRMIEISLGDPAPGDPLPPYEKGLTVDMAFLRDLAALIDFTKTNLHLELFELRELMRLKRQRDEADDEWDAINNLLEKAGRKRDSGFRLRPSDPRDFDTNLSDALGGIPSFEGITEVENIYDLYEQRNRSEVQAFIRSNLFFDPVEDFYHMMQIKVRIDSEWNAINLLLETAGQKVNSDFRFPGDFDPTNFEANLKSALDPDFTGFTGIGNLEQYYAAVREVERYMFMTAEKFVYLIDISNKAKVTAREWRNVYDILAAAYREKVYARRRRELQRIHEDRSFAGMIGTALGEALDQAEKADMTLLLERLKDYKISEDDFKFLEEVESMADSGNVTADQWERTYRILEIVQRIREDMPEPVAQKVEWLNLYPLQDATVATVQTGYDTDNQFSRWKTFGQPAPADGPDSAPQQVLGWAISSPQLALSQGERTINLTLGFEPDQFDDEKITPVYPVGEEAIEADQSPFQIELSTAKGWFSPAEVILAKGRYVDLISDAVPDTEKQNLQALQISFTIAAEIEGIAPLEDDPVFFESDWPVLKLLLRQVWNADSGQFVIHYPPFKDLKLACIHLRVEVEGMTDLLISNDETALAAGKPFEPFGSRPAAGSCFHLGHPELVNKKLEELKFNFEWMGVPEKLDEHYANYGEGINFTTRVSLVENQVEIPMVKKAPLFKNLSLATDPQSINITDVRRALEEGRSGFAYARIPHIQASEDLLEWNRYLQWTLNAPDFQHSLYPTLAAAKSLKLAADIADPETPVKSASAATYQVNPPYTPKLKSISVAYTSSLEITIEQYKPGVDIDHIFHLHPFGYNEVWLEPDGQVCCFLPQYDNQGELYIGLKDVKPPQRLSLLFQLAEGSADPDLLPASIKWSWLDENRWCSLNEGNVLFDSTRGLINSGIIEFDLPSAHPGTRMPANLYWIRAAAAENSRAVCDTIALHAQAVSATFEDNNNAPDHYLRPLPAGSITGPVKPIPKITGIDQPYTSYGGKSVEQDHIFYTRVSERLRHKQRGLTYWDYERLVLEHFPQIYKAKCLSAIAVDPSAEPGRVELIVIPDIRNQRPLDPFEPKAPADLIADIETYLSDKIPAWAELTVRNARYLPVKVRIGVRFKTGVDTGYYKQALNDELNRFLSPWAYEEGADIAIGGRIYANSIINFFDRRDYIDYVAGIKLFIKRDGRNFDLAQPVESEGYFVEADKPDAILVAARQHEFDIISEVGYDHEKFTGINYMKIELDFIVG